MTRPAVSAVHIDSVYDAMITMRLIAQQLSEGGVSDDQSCDMSWLLGSMRKRLEPVIELLEQFEFHQTHSDQPITATDDLLELGSDILALTEKLNRRRRALQEENA